jgi:RNA polymerase sigma-70 factor (ECF subfamily)
VRDAELEDAAQEVFVVVHRRLDSYDPNRPIKPWLCGIAHKVATAERRRARHRRERLCEAPAAGAVAKGSPEKRVALQQRFARVRQALGALDADQRVVFVMADMEEIACPDIADSLGISVNTVYSRLRRARARFKAELHRLRSEGGEA